MGKSYRVKNDTFNFKKGEAWLLADEGYQAYYGGQNFVFVNTEKSYRYIVSRNSLDEGIEIGCHLGRYFEEIE